MVIKKGKSIEKLSTQKYYKNSSESLVFESNLLESRANLSFCSFVKSGESDLLTVALF